METRYNRRNVYHYQKLEESKRKKRKKTNHQFNSRKIEYIKKPTNGKLLPNIKFTRKNRLDENSHPAEWLKPTAYYED